MEIVSFDVANVPVQVAAKALRVDAQTVRLLLQTGTVDWGCAYRLGKSRKFRYLISPKKFYEQTGFLYQGGVKNDR